MEYSSSYIRDNVKDYTLLTKARFGPYVYIRYKPIVREGMSFSWSVVLKETKDGYLFSNNLGSGHIFLLAAQAFPYWQDIAAGKDAGDLSEFQKTVFSYNESKYPASAGYDFDSSAVRLYYKLEQFSGARSLSAHQRQNIQNKLSNVLEGYKSGDPNKIVKSWALSVRNRILQNLKEEASVDATMEYFADIAHFNAEFFLKHDDVLFLYATTVSTEDEHLAPKAFQFKLEEGEYFFQAGQGEGNPFGRLILQSEAFQAIVNELLSTGR